MRLLVRRRASPPAVNWSGRLEPADTDARRCLRRGTFSTSPLRTQTSGAATRHSAPRYFNQRASQACTSENQKRLFSPFRIQWFSSGNAISLLGMRSRWW